MGLEEIGGAIYGISSDGDGEGVKEGDGDGLGARDEIECCRYDDNRTSFTLPKTE